MSQSNPYSKMHVDAIMTASKEDLTLMLYEGGIKFCNQALLALEKKEVQKAHELILRIQDIVREFQITLDHKYPISQEFNNLYDYMHRKLVEANLRKDGAILREVLDMFRFFRDTWKEAMKIARAG